jgi:Na+-translocating ferredoxin:NAD+ oxidoreductase RnfG subunit
MKKLLLNLLILAFSCYSFAAEPIVHNGVEGVFIEKDKAAQLAAIAEEYPHIKKQNELLQKEVDKYKELKDLNEKQLKVEEEISKSWENAFKSAQKENSETKAKDDVELYIYVGLFAGGTIVGAAMMYGASVLLGNLR